MPSMGLANASEKPRREFWCDIARVVFLLVLMISAIADAIHLNMYRLGGSDLMGYCLVMELSRPRLSEKASECIPLYGAVTLLLGF